MVAERLGIQKKMTLYRAKALKHAWRVSLGSESYFLDFFNNVEFAEDVSNLLFIS